jgi:hypothetical protein
MHSRYCCYERITTNKQLSSSALARANGLTVYVQERVAIVKG